MHRRGKPSVFSEFVEKPTAYVFFIEKFQLLLIMRSARQNRTRLTFFDYAIQDCGVILQKSNLFRRKLINA